MRSRETEDIRFILTLLCSTRAITLERTPDLGPINTPSSSAVKHLIEEYIPEFWKEINTGSIDLPIFTRYHSSTKSGPNGQALGTSLGDLLSLPENLVNDIKTLGGEKLASFMDTFLSTPTIIPLLQNIFSPLLEGRTYDKCRKLSCVRDKEGKQRVIAIFDY